MLFSVSCLTIGKLQQMEIVINTYELLIRHYPRLHPARLSSSQNCSSQIRAEWPACVARASRHRRPSPRCCYRRWSLVRRDGAGRLGCYLARSSIFASRFVERAAGEFGLAHVVGVGVVLSWSLRADRGLLRLRRRRVTTSNCVRSCPVELGRRCYHHRGGEGVVGVDWSAAFGGVR